MLVICEDCAKKYNIDEGRIKGNRARFTCNECGHIIIVNKDDLSRALINGVKPGKSSKTSSSVDLPGEMEDSGADSSSAEKKIVGKKIDMRSLRKKPHWKYRGIPVFAYLFVILMFTLVSVSLVTGYLYTEHLFTEYMSDVTNNINLDTNFRDKLMLDSSLAFGAVWLSVLLVFSIVGRLMHNKFVKLIKNANQLAAGETDIDIVKAGPREVRDLAFALERIRQRISTMTAL